MRVNLAAHTPPGLNPPYYSANLERDGRVSITVRSHPAAPAASAPTSCIIMSADTFRTLMTEGLRNLDASATVQPEIEGEYHEGDAGC